jgi:hypothetical protein
MFTMDIGTNLDLVFSLKGGPIRAKGIVATKYPQVGNGIDFIDMDPEDRLKLSESILDLEQRK